MVEEELKVVPTHCPAPPETDDIGDASNYHGFHVIACYPDGESETKWYALPR